MLKAYDLFGISKKVSNLANEIEEEYKGNKILTRYF